MRKVILFSLALAAIACGPPDVEMPQGNDQTDSDYLRESNDLEAPKLKDVPKSYPYSRLAVRGSVPNGVRVFVEGAGNPFAGVIDPVSKEFCVDIDLKTMPAHYSLTLRVQAADGTVSKGTVIAVERTDKAPKPSDTKLCSGATAG